MDRNAFHKLLAFGIERGVSDIHFEVGYPPHYRLHGELLGAIKVPPLAGQDTEAIGALLYAALTQRWPYEDDAHGLAGLHVGELCLLEVRRHPDLARHEHAGRRLGTDPQPTTRRCAAVTPLGDASAGPFLFDVSSRSRSTSGTVR